MVDCYRDAAPSLFNDLMIAAAADDSFSVRQTVHKLRGSTSMFGESELLRNLDAIERAARETPARCDHALVKKIPQELDAFFRRLRRATELDSSPAAPTDF